MQSIRMRFSVHTTAISVYFSNTGNASQQRFTATVGRVYASGDLAMLSVASPRITAALKAAPPPPDRSKVHVGFGFQNGELSADGLPVTFSPNPEARLNAFLPVEAQQELSRSGSLIDTTRPVLRFNKALEPGMSGGPIINYAGEVVGIVAGGLRAGTVPASWGWPAEWLATLLNSREPANTPVSIAGTFFTLHDLNAASAAIQTGRTIRCGDLNFSYRGRRFYLDVSRGSDDQQRLQIITQTSQPNDLKQLQFDIWTHQASGATAVMPAGYEISDENGACVARSRTGPFQQVLWGKLAHQSELQVAAHQFEASVMLPRVPYQFGWQWDTILTKVAPDAFGQMVPTTETRSDGLTFTRKGFVHPKTQLGFQGRTANSFETLAARNGSFMGVGTINDDVSPQLYQCLQVRWAVPDCSQIYAHFKEWTHFILSTQLSTYPVI